MKECLQFATAIGSRQGELSPEEGLALESHVARCAACRARLADAEVISDLVAGALRDEANQRDLSTFADGVLARIPAYSPRRGLFERLFGWVRHHRLVTAVSTLAPTVAAVALVIYLGGGSGQPFVRHLEVSTEGASTIVIETDDGPVVLFGDDDSEGT